MSEPRSHHIETPRTARFWTLGPEASREVWFVLHGYKQLARRFLRRFEAIDDGRRLIVAPEALSRFYVSPEPGRHGPESVVGATWMTREDREAEISDYVRYLDALAGTVLGEEILARPDGPGVTVLGFSQGVATATRWVVHGAIRPARLVLWGDTSPPDLDLERAAGSLAPVEVVMVHGDDDPALRSHLVQEERARLEAAGIDFRVVRYRGGHDIDRPTLESLATG